MTQLIDTTLGKAHMILGSECSPIGLMASPEGYPHVWARDSVITSLGALFSAGHENCLRVSLHTLREQQSELGAIPNNVSVDVEPGRADVPALTEVSWTEDSYVVLITTRHISDEAALRRAITSPSRYIGMIGSRAKCRTILEHLRADRVSEEALSRIYAPIGLDLGGTTPQEIAVAILAEIIAVRKGRREEEDRISFRRL